MTARNTARRRGKNGAKGRRHEGDGGVFTAVCACCGAEYPSGNPRRLYCSTRCRRDFQNERRREERAEAREARERQAWDEKPHWLQDPWAFDGKDDLDAWQSVWAQALLDPLPGEEAPWDHPAEPCPAKKKKRKKRRENPGWLWLPGVPQCAGAA